MKEVLPKIKLVKGYCNSYYIDDERKVLIDAGAEFQGEVDTLVLTHLHPDHVFHAKRIKERTGCGVLIGAEDAKPELMKDYFPVWDGKRVELFEVDEVLKDGDVVNTGSYEFRILHTPGHTMGSIVLFEESEGILFSGDLLFKNGVRGRTDISYSDEAEIKESIKRVKKLDYNILLPGHGSISKK